MTGVQTSTEPFEVLQGDRGVSVHLLRTDKYKTVLLRWIVEAPLDGDRAARAILPDLLTRGTASCPGLAQMAARCEELYNTDLVASVTAHGPLQMLRFGFDTIADRHAHGRELFAEAVAMLAEAMHEPPLVDGAFRADHLEQERSNLVRAIQGLSDDKHLHAYRRMIEAMHADTPRALHSWGAVEQAGALDEPAVHREWEQVVARAPARMLVVGDVTADQAVAAVDTLAGPAGHDAPTQPLIPPAIPRREPRVLVETQPLAQSKLAMGFRMRPDQSLTPAASLFGTVFGGDSHSRLFKRVREAESLAYGCSAGVSGQNATLVVQAGVDADAATRVRELVVEELERLASDGVSLEELDLSRRAQERRLTDLLDAPRGLCAFRHGALLDGRPHEIDQALADLRAVQPEDVAAVAASCELDTVFVLEGRGA
ncbi:MAG: M16 family metallopeptidase [Planctomycetota bacterium]|jgi:predicted Zn-dependent peptidase